MGVLINTSQNSKLLNLFQKHCSKLCVLSYLGGIIYFLMLSWAPCNNRTYFSENALLPGLVQREYSFGSIAEQLLESFREEAKDHPSLPFPWLQGQFRQLGLDVYVHNFTLHYPLGSKPKYTGQNVYAILHAPRSSGNEAMVISSPYRTQSSLDGTTLPGIALMISLAKYFRRYNYWAKDIIFLITEHELVGFQAWLDAYHDIETSPGVLDPGTLTARSGAIQAAINLELHGESIKNLDIKILGLNGQLPNLDLFNLAVELAARESVSETFHNRDSPMESQSMNGWLHALQTMSSMMMVQSTGIPNGAHGLFHRYAIQAITLEGHTEGSGHANRGFNHVGRIMEGIMRSLNNLLERFHQSFFFYLLPSTRRYVSIGLYMPAFAAIAAPALLKAAALFLMLDTLPSKNNTPESKKSGVSLWSALPFCVISYSLGLVMLIALPHLDAAGRSYKFSTQDSLFFGSLSMIVLSLFLPLFGRRTCREEFIAQRCFTLLNFAAFVYTLALLNISMATFIAVIMVPVMLTAGTFKHWFLVLVHRFLQLCIHPFAFFFLTLLCHTMYLDSWALKALGSNLNQVLNGQKKSLLFSLEDWYIYGNWTFPVLTCLIIPIWLQMWFLRNPN